MDGRCHDGRWCENRTNQYMASQTRDLGCSKCVYRTKDSLLRCCRGDLPCAPACDWTLQMLLIRLVDARLKMQTLHPSCDGWTSHCSCCRSGTCLAVGVAAVLSEGAILGRNCLSCLWIILLTWAV